MKKLCAVVCLTGLSGVVVPANLAAQDLVISNARIIVGNGSVIESGTLVIRSGRIASVGAATAAPAGARPVAARGTTPIPRFIDRARRHIRGQAEHRAEGYGRAPDAESLRGRVYTPV